MSDPFAAARAQLKSGKSSKAATSAKPDPFVVARGQVKAGKYKGAPIPKQTTVQGKLLTAIAIANGHSNPNLWAREVTDVLAKL